MSELKHYGTPRHSGRYPWGSGENPYQSLSGFLSSVYELRQKGLTEAEIARGMGITTTQLRARISIARSEKRAADVAMAIRLKDKGYSNVAIGERMGINESSVRSLLNPTLQERAEITATTAKMLKENVDSKRYLDIGAGTENHLGISKTKLNTAIAMLQEQGYKVQYVKVEQVGVPGNFTSVKVLTPPDVTYSELYKNQHNIKTIANYSDDGGRSFLGIEPIKSIDSKRIKIIYNEDGGADKDGVIELRRGVDELSLGDKRYAQVRIGVDGTHYLKGMVIYSDNMPDGIDILYNTNKKRGTPPEKVFKTMEDDPDNPFGSIIRQKHYIDSEGNRQLSALNIVGSKEGSGEEGAWNEWSRTISSQVLSKQPTALAKRQLDMAFDIKKEEFDEINSLTNPAVKKRLLLSFADDCDASAVHLKAAALPRQRNHVLLPFPDIKENEIYAPNFRDGERVVLIRHPHGGKFEIPELIVNNKQPYARQLFKDRPADDAVGIHPKVAERLSGADFDGDTVLVIPNSPKVGIRTSAPLKGLKNFDPEESYKGYEGMPIMKKESIGRYMGDISNLITDMSIKGATESEIARAVRHSMVVIDAHKHGLNYKQSYIDNGIAALKEKYQGSSRAGASTLISRASSDKRIPAVKKEYKIDPKTGKKILTETGETYVDRKTGKTVLRTTKTTKMAATDDAFTLSSGTPMETIYATHANKLKALANQARKEYLNTGTTPYSPTAKKTYSKEVSSLDAKLNVALKNAPLERQAQILANQVVKLKREANPGMDKDDLKKVKTQALNEARNRTGAKKQQISITDREWEAIQAGAISNNKLTKILNNTDLDQIKQLATPRTKVSLSPAKEKRALSMLNTGYTYAEIADALGISVSTISNLKGGDNQ